MKRLLLALILATTAHNWADAQSNNESFSSEDRRQELIASRWIESFTQLDANNNIVMVLVGYDKLYELKGVTSITANRRFLVVRYRGADGKEYKSLVYPSSILIIKEGPKG